MVRNFDDYPDFQYKIMRHTVKSKFVQYLTNLMEEENGLSIRTKNGIDISPIENQPCFYKIVIVLKANQRLKCLNTVLLGPLAPLCFI